MRSILVYLYLFYFFTIKSLIYLPYLYILRRFNSEKSYKIAQKAIRNAFFKALKLAGCDLEIINKPVLKPDEPYLFVSNHRSYVDIVVLYALIDQPSSFMGKKELTKFPILKQWMILINTIFIDRENVKESFKSILKGIDVLKSNKSIYIAPEGTRNKSEGILPFKSGAFAMANKTKCTIVPILLTNTAEVFEKSFPKITSKNIKIEYLEPINTKSLSKEELKELPDKIYNNMSIKYNLLLTNNN